MTGSTPVRIVVIGAGHVGATFAYALLLSGLAAEIVLVDKDYERALGEAMDLNHAMPFTRPALVRAGELADCEGAAITVMAAGANQKPGETRLDLVRRNADVLRAVVPEVAKCNPGGIILIATNPVDVLTYAAWKLSGMPAERVIGSGTILDSARFRFLLGRHFGVDPRSVHAHIIGEHGDSEVAVWSLANIAGVRLRDYCKAENVPLEEAAMQEIFRQTRDAAYEILKRKGATYYAVAAGLVRICEAILRDQNTVLSVSSRLDGLYRITGVALSLPSVVNHKGIARVLALDLSPDEVTGLRGSAEVLRKVIHELGFD